MEMRQKKYAKKNLIMTSKQFYKNYVADDEISMLSIRLFNEILELKPVHVFEFGCGTGKNLKLFDNEGIATIGSDISFVNIVTGIVKHRLPCMIYCDETYLRNIINCDVVFTCSVLDHIEDPEEIIQEFKRIANKSVFLAETNDIPADFYYPHPYEDYGFTKIDFSWTSRGDRAVYNIWVWKKY
jgi:SAM-dependent methyltransferase